MSVLFVDDEPSMGDIARIFLEDRLGGCKVTQVTDGDEALEHIHSQRYDAIVADYEMPGLNGLQLLRALRTAGDNTPFLVCTGKSRHEVVIEALNAGADFYLQKGEDPLVLFTEMKQMIVQAVTRRRSEKALAKSRKLLEEIIDFLPDATLAVDSSERIIAWNRTMEELTGIPSETVLFKCQDFSECIFRYPGVSSLIERIMILGERTSADPHHPGIENRIITEEYHGQVGEGTDNDRYYRIMVSPILDSDMEKVGFIGSVRDITNQKRSEYALLESRENFRALVENNTDIVMRFDLKGRHLYVNPSIKPYIPFEPSHLLGKTYRELEYPPQKADEWDTLIQRVIATGYPHEADITFQSPKGKVTLNWRLFPEFDLEGKVRSVLSISRDITYQREFEQEKQALLSQIERNLGEFAILNDGIRNPLAVITGWLSMMNMSEKERSTLMHQIKQIDEMITQLDRRWVESEKVLGFLRRHYAIRTSPDQSDE
ncbi:MAG TPA: PAS domain S-box protein [Methanospirillum sp.]|nr:PAS domain S-box protein [Methanospirillum sp.]HOL40743.1 PAS domain S-box protein [Methanospirillum sp.]HPP76611.1 PAS domain S-box protein [Methanospirillum sp.]